MSACGVCNLSCDSTNEEIVKCAGGCDKMCHVSCAENDAGSRKTQKNREWKCKDCINSSSRSSLQSSAAGNITKDFLLRVMEQFKGEVFSELKKEIKSVRNDMQSLSESVQFVSDKMDTANELMLKIQTELAEVKKENESLRAQNKNLTSEVCTLSGKVRALEQYSRRNNIEISGLPTSPNEDVSVVIRDVGKALGLAVQDGQVSASHRVPSFKQGRTPALIVQFTARTTRDAWLAKYKELNTKGAVHASDVNKAFPKQRMYINEHLSPENKVFLSQLKQKCRDVGYSFVWCREGKFFVRRGQGEGCRRINTYEDITNLK